MHLDHVPDDELRVPVVVDGEVGPVRLGDHRVEEVVPAVVPAQAGLGDHDRLGALAGEQPDEPAGLLFNDRRGLLVRP